VPAPAPPTVDAAAAGDASAIGPGLASGWCVIAGSIGYDRFAEATALVERLHRAGFPDAGIYDPRDFENLAWGTLAVIATGGLATPGEARTAAAALAKASVAADIKKCAVGPENRARPLARASDVAPLPALPSGPPVQLAGATPFEQPAVTGCFAWSAKLNAPACLVGYFDTYAGQWWALAFPGTPVPHIELSNLPEAPGGRPREALEIPAATLREINTRFTEAQFVALPAPARPLQPGGHVDWVVPRFAVRWDKQDPAIEIRCGGLDRPWQDVLRHERQLPSSTATVRLVPGTKLVVIDQHLGDYGEGFHSATETAAVVDLATCRVERDSDDGTPRR